MNAKLIALRARDGSVRAHALVDDEDFDWLNQWRWHLTTQGYAGRRDASILMHREILSRKLGRPLTHGELAHHVLEGDENKLDNRRANLELTTRGRHPRQHFAHSGLGVSLHKASGRWKAYTGKRHLGLYDTRGEALAVVAAARRGETITRPPRRKWTRRAVSGP